jgi:hypothetical protein
MTRHASHKERIQIHTLLNLGWNLKNIASHLTLSERQVQYLAQQPETPRKRPGRPRPLSEEDRQRNITFVTQDARHRRMAYSPDESAMHVVGQCRAWVTRRPGKEYNIDCIIPKFSKLSRCLLCGSISGEHGIGSYLS